MAEFQKFSFVLVNWHVPVSFTSAAIRMLSEFVVWIMEIANLLPQHISDANDVNPTATNLSK